MSDIKAIATVEMPYGTYVEVDREGAARPDPTFECRGGVVRRPPGPSNNCAAGEALKIATEGPIQCLSSWGLNISIVLEKGRVKGGPGAVPGLRRK